MKSVGADQLHCLFYVIGNEAHGQGAAGRVEQSVLGSVVTVSGLSDRADIDYMSFSRVQPGVALGQR